METGALADLAQGLVYMLAILLYLSASLIVYRWLFPRLLPFARVLAMILLMAQAVVTVLSVATESSTGFEYWLWDIDLEWNVPSTLASTQLALVGAASLVVAGLWVKGAIWHRLYFVGIGIVFLFFAYDEYFTFHETFSNWQDLYVNVGAAMAVSTLVLALRMPRPTWRFFVSLPMGLALAGLGAIRFDIFTRECGGWAYIFFSGECIKVSVIEESLEFLGIWLSLVAMLGLFSSFLAEKTLHLRRALSAWLLIWVVFLLQSDAIPQPSYAEAAAAKFESDVQLHGYEIEKGKRVIRVNIFLSPSGRDFGGLGYSIRLVDQASQSSIVWHDTYANKRLDFIIAPGFRHVYRQWVELNIPPDAPTNRAYWIVLTLWREEDDDFIRQKVLSSDRQLLSDTQIILDEFTIRPDSVTAPSASLAMFENGFALEAVDMPVCARIGETIDITFAWRTDSSSSDDLVQFLHFVDSDKGAFWNYDQQPLGTRLPTRLWYTGLSDSEVWQVPLPADLVVSNYALFTGLYRQGVNERVMARGTDDSPFLDARVPLGSMVVKRAC